MKHISYLFVAFLCCCVTLQAKERVVERPSFSVWSSGTLEIQKIVLSDTATVFFIEAHYNPNMWIKIASGSYIQADGKKYPIRSGAGMELDKEIWMPDSGTRDFQMVFPPLPENTTEVSFTEGPDVMGGFSVWGIRLDGKQVTSPMEGKTISKEKPVLETPVLKPGTAVLSGKLLMYSPEMDMKGSVYAPNVITANYEEYPVNVEADGTFRVKIPLLHPTSVNIRSPFLAKSVYLKPGEETMVTVNLPEYCRASSLLRKDEPSLGPVYSFEGAFAALNNEACNHLLQEIAIEPAGQEAYMQMFKDISTMDAVRFKAYWLKRYNDGLKELDKYPDMSDAYRTLLKQNAGIAVSRNLLGAPFMIEYAYRTVNNIPRDSVLTDFVKPVIDEAYYDFLPEYVPNNPQALYSDFFPYLIRSLQYITISGEQIPPDPSGLNPLPRLAKLIKTDRGIIFDLITLQKAAKPITEFIPLTDEQIAGLDSSPDMKALLVDMNNNLKQTIENNKKLSDYKIGSVDVADIPAEETFRAIVTPYRGKVVFVDFWATWCGPCKEALKDAEPVKAEFEGEDVVFLYLAGENSPIGTWNKMIPEIKGDHYRVTQAQWDYFGKEFGVSGIPAYMVVAKDGTVVYFHTGFMGATAMREILNKELAK